MCRKRLRPNPTAVRRLVYKTNPKARADADSLYKFTEKALTQARSSATVPLHVVESLIRLYYAHAAALMAVGVRPTQARQEAAIQAAAALSAPEPKTKAQEVKKEKVVEKVQETLKKVKRAAPSKVKKDIEEVAKGVEVTAKAASGRSLPRTKDARTNAAYDKLRELLGLKTKEQEQASETVQKVYKGMDNKIISRDQLLERALPSFEQFTGRTLTKRERQKVKRSELAVYVALIEDNQPAAVEFYAAIIAPNFAQKTKTRAAPKKTTTQKAKKRSQAAESVVEEEIAPVTPISPTAPVASEPAETRVEIKTADLGKIEGCPAELQAICRAGVFDLEIGVAPDYMKLPVAKNENNTRVLYASGSVLPGTYRLKQSGRPDGSPVIVDGARQMMVLADEKYAGHRNAPLAYLGPDASRERTQFALKKVGDLIKIVSVNPQGATRGKSGNWALEPRISTLLNAANRSGASKSNLVLGGRSLNYANLIVAGLRAQNALAKVGLLKQTPTDLLPVTPDVAETESGFVAEEVGTEVEFGDALQQNPGHLLWKLQSEYMFTRDPELKKQIDRLKKKKKNPRRRRRRVRRASFRR